MRLSWDCLSRTERDAAYDNSAAVPASAALNAERLAASAAYRAEHGGHLDLPYGPRERQKWDLFPAVDPDAPCLAFIHGGYWQRNSREAVSVLGTGVRAQGWAAAFPGYTLAPDASLAEIVAEIHAAFDWLAAEGVAHGVAGPVVVSGWSAGGHLAALALPHPRISAGLAISGVYELGPLRDTGLNDALRLTDVEIATLSPLRLPVSGKPLGIAYGSRELPALISDSRDLHARRAASHAPGPLIPVPDANHFTILDELRRPGGALVRAALGLLP